MKEKNVRCTIKEYRWLVDRYGAQTSMDGTFQLVRVQLDLALALSRPVDTLRSSVCTSGQTSEAER